MDSTAASHLKVPRNESSVARILLAFVSTLAMAVLIGNLTYPGSHSDRKYPTLTLAIGVAPMDDTGAPRAPWTPGGRAGDAGNSDAHNGGCIVSNQSGPCQDD